MKTKEKIETKKPLNADTERKRELITFQVTHSEKKEITEEAIGVRGIPVSQYVRIKMFDLESAQTEPDILENPMDDEERETFNAKLKELKEENDSLKAKQTETKPAIAAPTFVKTEAKPTPGNALTIECEPEFKALFERIKTNREEKALTLNEEELKSFYNFNDYLKVLLLRGLQRSYNIGNLKDSTGLTGDEFNEEKSKITTINEDDI